MSAPDAKALAQEIVEAIGRAMYAHTRPLEEAQRAVEAILAPHLRTEAPRGGAWHPDHPVWIALVERPVHESAPVTDTLCRWRDLARPLNEVMTDLVELLVATIVKLQRKVDEAPALAEARPLDPAEQRVIDAAWSASELGLRCRRGDPKSHGEWAALMTAAARAQFELERAVIALAVEGKR